MESKLALSFDHVANYWWDIKELMLGKSHILKTSRHQAALVTQMPPLGILLDYHHIEIQILFRKKEQVILTGPLK